MAHTVEDDLHDRALVAVAATGLGHAGQRKAVARAEPVCGGAMKGEGARIAGSDGSEFYHRVAGPGLVRGKPGENDGIVRGGRKIGGGRQSLIR